MAEQTSGPAPYRPEPSGSRGLPSFVGTALAAAILLVAGGGVFAGGYFTNAAVDDDGGGDAEGAPTAPSGSPTVVVQPTQAPLVAASVDDDPAWGPEDAAVTIIEFSDFQ